MPHQVNVTTFKWPSLSRCHLNAGLLQLPLGI